MARVALDLPHLQYILAHLPDQPNHMIGKQARGIIQSSITAINKSNEHLEFEWFSDPNNQDLPLKNFIQLPSEVLNSSITDFFGTFKNPVYVRVINALLRRGCKSIRDLMDLTIFQFGSTRNLGDRSHLAILQALHEKKNPL